MPFLKNRSKVQRSRTLENSTKKEGLRHAVFNTVGDEYIGEWKSDLKTGKGALLTRYRQLYEGNFESGYRHGFGVLSYEDEFGVFVLEYRGNWRKGKMHGLGFRRYKDGGVYVGNWKYGNRNGYGLMWYSDGQFYAGEWANDNRQGLGMLVRPDTSRYEGNWFNDLKHGRGCFLHLVTGQKQQGVWIQNVCAFSTFTDIRYRQSTLHATKYPIQKIELLNVNDICNEREMKVLSGIVGSCIIICDSISSELNHIT